MFGSRNTIASMEANSEVGASNRYRTISLPGIHLAMQNWFQRSSASRPNSGVVLHVNSRFTEGSFALLEFLGHSRSLIVERPSKIRRMAVVDSFRYKSAHVLLQSGVIEYSVLSGTSRRRVCGKTTLHHTCQPRVSTSEKLQACAQTPRTKPRSKTSRTITSG